MNIDWLGRIWPLMEEAFPSVERRTLQGEADILRRDDVCMRVITEGGQVTAFMIWWELPTCIFGEHLAVLKGLRGNARGTTLLTLLKEISEREQKPFVLEVEPPQQSEQALRRLRFYRRNGFVFNDFPYKQQPLKTGDEPADLCIMSYRKGFTAQQFLPLKQDIYRTVYNLSGEALKSAL